MADPSSTTFAAIAGVGLTAAAARVFGPLLGEYIIILGGGILGTMVALADAIQEENTKLTWWQVMAFVFRGVALSVAFSGLTSLIIIPYIPIPEGYNITPYALTGPISFAIGWTSNKWKGIKDKVIDLLSSISFGKK